MSKQDAKAAFGLSERALSKVPIVHTLPGRYSPRCANLYNWRRWLLSHETARNIALEIHGGEEGLNSYINSNASRARAKAAYDQRVANRNALNRFDVDDSPLALLQGDVCRYMVTTHLPYFDTKSRLVTQTSLSCKGCVLAYYYTPRTSDAQRHALADRWNRTYTEDMFLDHLKTCRETQRFWAKRHDCANNYYLGDDTGYPGQDLNFYLSIV